MSAAVNHRASPAPASQLRPRHGRVVVALSHDDHQRFLGGVQLYMRVQRQALDAHAISYVNVWPLEGGQLGVSADGEPLEAKPADSVIETISALVSRGTEVAAIDLHHVKGWRVDDVVRLTRALPAPRVRLYVHDYYMVCPNQNLTFGEHLFCGAPPPSSQACALCRYGEARRQRQPAMHALVDELAARTALEVIAPSEVAAAHWSAEFPAHRARVRVVPHQELVAGDELLPPPGGPLRLGFVGWGTAIKGVGAWRALTESPEIRARYVLSHYGLCSIGCRAEHVDVDFIRDGHDAMRAALRAKPLDFAFLWSVWPETFSFTCHEAIEAGAFVITSAASGNIAAEVTRSGRGRVFDDFAAAHRFLLDDSAVLATRKARAGQPRVTTHWVDTLTRELS